MQKGAAPNLELGGGTENARLPEINASLICSIDNEIEIGDEDMPEEEEDSHVVPVKQNYRIRKYPDGHRQAGGCPSGAASKPTAGIAQPLSQSPRL